MNIKGKEGCKIIKNGFEKYVFSAFGVHFPLLYLQGDDPKFDLELISI
jgi:hypothetical protein